MPRDIEQTTSVSRSVLPTAVKQQQPCIFSQTHSHTHIHTTLIRSKQKLPEENVKSPNIPALLTVSSVYYCYM